jgi:hypothetical protein
MCDVSKAVKAVELLGAIQILIPNLADLLI